MNHTSCHGPALLTRRFASAAIALSVLGMASGRAGTYGGPARGPTVTIVLSGDQAPYKAAATAAASVLETTGAEVRTVMSEALKPEQVSGAAQGDVFVATGTEAALKLHRSLPAGVTLIYCMAGGSEAAELATGRADTAGVTTDIPIVDQVKLIAEALPQARRFAMMFRSSNSRSAALKAAFETALPSGCSVRAVDLDHEASVADAIKRLLSDKPDLVWTGADSSVFSGTTVQALLKESLGSRVPVFGFSTQFVRAGAIIGVGIRPEDQGRRAGELVREQITGGADRKTGSNGPIQELPRVRIGVNTIVAERLGILLPPALVKRADDVFEP